MNRVINFLFSISQFIINFLNIILKLLLPFLLNIFFNLFSINPCIISEIVIVRIKKRRLLNCTQTRLKDSTIITLLYLLLTCASHVIVHMPMTVRAIYRIWLERGGFRQTGELVERSHQSYLTCDSLNQNHTQIFSFRVDVS